MENVKFCSIEGFHTVKKNAKKSKLVQSNFSITYQGKVKLHGTNAGILCQKDGSVYPVKRSGIIPKDDDNYGFAAWVKKNEKAWSKFGKILGDVVVFGEWCGPGIQKGVAASKLDRPIFAIFAFMMDELGTRTLVTHPCRIKFLMDKNDLFPVSDTYILPYGTKEYIVNFNKQTSLGNIVSEWNKLVEACEECDPFISESFGIDGIGEGYVFYPFADRIDSIPVEDFSRFAIKAKGEKHSVTKQRAPVQIDPEVAKSIEEYIDNVVTENRLLQGWAETGANVSDNPISHIGQFLGWVGKDVAKETVSELNAAGLEWKSVNKHVTNKAREWFLNKVNEE